MLAVRYAYLLALLFWLGGLLTIGGVVAPATFEALTNAGGPEGRALAGLAFGAVLRRFHLGAYAAATVMFVSLLLAAVLGPRPVRLALRLGILSAMTAMTLYSGLVVSGRVERMQREIGGPVAALPESDPRRAVFGRLHRLSTTLMMATAGGGLILLYWEARAHE